MHHEPVRPPQRIGGTAAAIRRARVARVANGLADVRFVLGRGGRTRVPVAAGVTVTRGDLVAVVSIEGNDQLPLIIAKLPAGFGS